MTIDDNGHNADDNEGPSEESWATQWTLLLGYGGACRMNMLHMQCFRHDQQNGRLLRQSEVVFALGQQPSSFFMAYVLPDVTSDSTSNSLLHSNPPLFEYWKVSSRCKLSRRLMCARSLTTRCPQKEVHVVRWKDEVHESTQLPNKYAIRYGKCRIFHEDMCTTWTSTQVLSGTPF